MQNLKRNLSVLLPAPPGPHGVCRKKSHCAHGDKYIRKTPDILSAWPHQLRALDENLKLGERMLKTLYNLSLTKLDDLYIYIFGIRKRIPAWVIHGYGVLAHLF